MSIFFLFRKGQFLNVRGEKTSESLFYQALTKTTSAWFPRKLLNYCCVESLLIEDKGIALILLSLYKNTIVKAMHIYRFGSFQIKQLQELLPLMLSLLHCWIKIFRWQLCPILPPFPWSWWWFQTSNCRSKRNGKF